MRAAVVTITDTRNAGDDVSGVTLAGLLLDIQAVIAEKVIVSDEADEIKDILRMLSDRDDIDLIITTGGTGLGPRDNTPEATLEVIEREAPGIAEAMRRESAARTPLAMLSRGVCGTRNGTLVINFPGSPRAVEECFAVIRPILGHALDLIRGKTAH